MFGVNVVVSPQKTDCGPTCLNMLLSYYGIASDVNALSKECGISVSGVTMAALKRAGEARGLDMRAYDMDAEYLASRDRPAIIWWRYKHFCIFDGLDESGKVVFINPDSGRMRLGLESFSRLYAGKALFAGEPQELIAIDPLDAAMDALDAALGGE